MALTKTQRLKGSKATKRLKSAMKHNEDDEAMERCERQCAIATPERRTADYNNSARWNGWEALERPQVSMAMRKNEHAIRWIDRER